MSMEIRKHLEVELLAALKQTTSAHLDLKASKNKLGLLADKEKLGEIYVQNLTKADGYYAGLADGIVQGRWYPAGASVKYIDSSDNRGAGSSIGNVLSDLPNGTRVKIEVY
ncbi:hypothetical protein [Pseudomonas kilonensis]|uniref:hypothetical protein n=1 Tax=Pseudomonas kilonensis TaxID=132476 RepID=UPI000ACBE37C|nr:hypothetical protein [Pseudomonas kilonensis]